MTRSPDREPRRLDRRQRDLLDRYLDHDLRPGERDEVNRLLAEAPAFGAEVQAYESLFRALASLPYPPVPAGFDAPILAALFPQRGTVPGLLRAAVRVYGAGIALFASCLVAWLAVAAGRAGSAEGAAASGLSRAVDALVSAVDRIATATAGLLGGLMAVLRPVETVLHPLVEGARTAAVVSAPQVVPILVLTTVLAATVLYWAATPRKRGVPHVLSL